MLDKCTEILMRKYQPGNPLLEWANQSLAIPVEKQASSQGRIISDGKVFTVLMSSADYTDKRITAVCDEYNRKHPEHMSFSYQLPADMFGIPANSWVLGLPKGGQL